MQQAYKRVREGVATILEKPHTETVVVVAAQIVCGLIECCVTGRSLDELWTVVEQNTPVRNFEKVGDQWVLAVESGPEDGEADLPTACAGDASGQTVRAL